MQWMSAASTLLLDPARWSRPMAILISAAAAALAIWLLLRLRKKKSEAEREMERRIAVNSVGRMTDGILTDALDSPVALTDAAAVQLLFYRYSVAGVEYSAAQDVSALQGVIGAGACLPGEAVTVKYQPQQPSNSIVVCEVWNGLRRVNRAGNRAGTPRRESPIASGE